MNKQKIADYDTHKNNSNSHSGRFKDYCKAITIADQKQSICTSGVENPCSTLPNSHEGHKKGKHNMPSKYEILNNSTFGKTSSDHTFTSEASFEHILIFVLKGKFILGPDKENLLDSHPLIRHFNKMLVWSHNIQFADITNPIENYANQKSIDKTRIKKLLAATFHYDMDIPTVIRFLGNNYTGEYKNSKNTIEILKKSKCDDEIVHDLERLFTLGAPNKLNASSSQQNFLEFFRYGNHSSIGRDKDKIAKAMNKEDRNQFVIPLPAWLARFIKNLHLTPQGLLTKPGKDDRLIWDGSFIPTWRSTSINMMLTHESEPRIVYGNTFTRHLESIWNLRISHPYSDILLFDDDVKGAFRHCKYHPDIATAFSFAVDQLLFIPLGGTFGSITSPANFEPIARARTHLAEFLSDRRDLLSKYEHIINKVQFSEEPTVNTGFVQAVRDSTHKGVKNLGKTSYNMFVDDNLFAQTKENIKHAMAASIEALYIILGFPELDKRQDALSLDKYFESICSHDRTQLGFQVNTRKMSVGLTEKKRLLMLSELSHWHTQRKSFTLMQGVILCGSLEFWANTSPWIRFIYHQLRSSVNKCLTNCLEISKNKEDIKKLISNVANTTKFDEHELQDRMLQRTIAKETYKCQHKTFIDNSMRTELDIMKQILSNPKKYNLETPIAHIIKRDPDFTSYGDACLEAGGGYSENLFWWHVEWPKQIKLLTIKNLTVTRKCLQSNNLVSINLLEFVVEIINYAAITLLFQNHPALCKHGFPLLLNWTDNMSSKTWLRKAATRTIKGKALQRILCSLMINNPVGIKADHIAGTSNTLADVISRVYTTSYSETSFHKIFQEYPQMKSWKRFHPSQELLSVLYSALLQGQDHGLCPPNKLGHFAQDSNISYSF